MDKKVIILDNDGVVMAVEVPASLTDERIEEIIAEEVSIHGWLMAEVICALEGKEVFPHPLGENETSATRFNVTNKEDQPIKKTISLFDDSSGNFIAVAVVDGNLFDEDIKKIIQHVKDTVDCYTQEDVIKALGGRELPLLHYGM